MNKSLVVIPFDIPWSWSTDYTNQTAKILSRKHLVLCLLLEDSLSIKEYLALKNKPKLFKKHTKNFYIYRPIQIIPFRRFKTVHNLNIFLNLLFVSLILFLFKLAAGITQGFLWLFHPKLYPATKYFGGHFKIIYDCVDFFDYGASKKRRKKLKEYEGLLAKNAYLVTANSNVLLDKLKKYRKDVHLVPQGFRVADFAKSLKTKSLSKKLKKELKRKKIIGFAGGINSRLDFNLLIPLIKNNPQWQFVIWGPIQKEGLEEKTIKKIEKLLSLPNVIHGVFESRKRVPAIIRKFDIGIIPYDSSQDFNKYCYPMKIFEYFYVGIPTVSTTITELKRFPKFVKISEKVDGWEKNINSLLSKPWPEAFKKEQRKLSKENSWDNKIKKILDLINNS